MPPARNQKARMLAGWFALLLAAMPIVAMLLELRLIDPQALRALPAAERAARAGGWGCGITYGFLAGTTVTGMAVFWGLVPDGRTRVMAVGLVTVLFVLVSLEWQPHCAAVWAITHP